jgi:hypothetical protein
MDITKIFEGKALTDLTPAFYADYYAQRAQLSGEQLEATLVQGNERYTSGAPIPKNFASQMEVLMNGQDPVVAALACSDSRFKLDYMFDTNLGEIFTVLVAGGSSSKAAVGSFEYGGLHLPNSIKLLVVIGHEDCGAVNAARKAALAMVDGSATKTGSRDLEHVKSKILTPETIDVIQSGVCVKGVTIMHTRAVIETMLFKSQTLRERALCGDLRIVPVYLSFSGAAEFFPIELARKPDGVSVIFKSADPVGSRRDIVTAFKCGAHGNGACPVAKRLGVHGSMPIPCTSAPGAQSQRRF